MEKATKRVLLVVSTGFEETEAVTCVDLLRRAKFDVTIANATDDSNCVKGTNNIGIGTDTSLDKCLDDKWDAIVLPGGNENAKSLGSNKKLIEMLKKQKAEGRWICAICASPVDVLAKNGLLEGEKATCFQEMLKELPENIRSTERVVISNRIITSQSPGTAIEFASAIIASLSGAKCACKIVADVGGQMASCCADKETCGAEKGQGCDCAAKGKKCDCATKGKECANPKASCCAQECCQGGGKECVGKECCTTEKGKECCSKGKAGTEEMKTQAKECLSSECKKTSCCKTECCQGGGKECAGKDCCSKRKAGTESEMKTKECAGNECKEKDCTAPGHPTNEAFPII